MPNDQIQITYEDPASQLALETETKMIDALTQLLIETGQAGRMLSLHFCSLETMTQLNSEYRGKQIPTDLLSWLYQSDDVEQHSSEEPWGELVYCLEIIRKQASKSGWDLESELLRLTVHGLVHLLGHDHESEEEEAEMLRIETDLLKRIGLEDVYPG